MAKQNGPARLVYGLACLVALLIVTFATVVLVQQRWSRQIQLKYEENRRKIETLQTQCAEKIIQDALSSKLGSGSEHVKRQAGSLQQMIQDMMDAQERILLSHCFNNTALCVKGLKGPGGVKGDVGQQGSIGTMGNKGALGLKGDMGVPGAKGIHGDRGIPGDQGIQGLRGQQGLRGPTGVHGTAGHLGLAGHQGATGAKGDKGDRGPTGLAGPNGTVGTTGQKGAKGDHGLAGSKGERGSLGPRGQVGDVLQKDCMCIRKPVIDVFQPSLATVNVPIGKNLNLTCGSTSIPTPTITWHLPDDNCTSGQTVSNSSNLSISSLQPSQFGVYRCEASNMYGSTSKTFTVQSNAVGALDCDFEKPCVWENDYTDYGDWTLRHGPTPTLVTGPSVDHTLGTSRGYYMYTRSYSSSHRTNRVHLLSPELGSTARACLSFWYHMYGQNEGTLYVENQDTCNTTRITTRYFGTAGNKNDIWHPATVSIPATQGKHRLVISTLGNGPSSDVALDDITYHEGSCAPLMSRTGTAVKNLTVSVGDRLDLNCGIEGAPKPSFTWNTSGGCVTNSQATGENLHVTDYVSSGTEGTYTCTATENGLSPLTTTYNVKVTGFTGACDLEHGSCGWTQDKNDIFDWSLLSGPTGSTETGPATDHTINTAAGKFYYIEASSPRTIGQDAVLRSSLQKGQRDACFSLYYNMYGANMGNLTVLIQDKCTKKITELFTISGDKGTNWHFRSVNISAASVPNDYNILVKGTVGSGFHSDMAIDDLTISNDLCGAPSTIDCTFEAGLCKWTQSSTDDFDWTKHQGSSPTTGTGPLADHTTGSGHYLYTEASSQSQGDKADLLSPVLPGGKEYCFHLATAMYGATMGSIKIMTKGEGLGGRSSSIATYTVDASQVWRTHNIHIMPQPNNFRIVIEGIIGSSYYSDAAIDDVKLTQGPC